MPDSPLVHVDLNVLLDVLQKREPFYEASASLLALAETGQIQVCTAAHSITTLFYLIQKGRSTADARAAITSLMQFIAIAPVTQRTIEQALNLDMRDFEDAVQMVSAIQVKASFLITRNVRDYQPSLLPVLKPIEFLSSL